MSKQFSVTRDEMYTMVTDAHENATNVMTESNANMIAIICDGIAEDAIWADSDGQVITGDDIIAVVEEWRADNRVEETTPTTPAPVVTVAKPTFWVKVIGGEFCGYVQAVDMRSAVLKAIGKRASTKSLGIAYDVHTQTAQVLKHTRYGTMIIDRVSVVQE
jgi:hypothetical protein